jgi:hypothetical protein
MKTKTMAAKPRAERTYTLTLSECDIDHLHWVLEGEVEMQKDMMNTPDPKAKPEEQLEGWAIGREFMLHAMRLKQIIEKVYKPRSIKTVVKKSGKPKRKGVS